MIAIAPSLPFVRERTTPPFYVLDQSFGVVFSSLPDDLDAFLRPRLAKYARELERGMFGQDPAMAYAAIGNGIVLRMVKLQGVLGPHFGMFVERFAPNDGVSRSAKRWSLSSREEEVLTLIARGYSTNRIADALSIALSTARDHIASIMRKTGSSRRTQLVGKLVSGKSEEGVARNGASSADEHMR